MTLSNIQIFSQRLPVYLIRRLRQSEAMFLVFIYGIAYRVLEQPPYYPHRQIIVSVHKLVSFIAANCSSRAVAKRQCAPDLPLFVLNTRNAGIKPHTIC